MLDIAIIVVCVFFLAIKWRLQQTTIGYYDNRHVLITGCDTGFGNMLALRLDSMGFTVFSGCMGESGAQEIKRMCSERLKTIILDVTSTESIQKAVNFVQDNLPEGKGLWGLVNNAGVLGPSGHIHWFTSKDYEETMRVNFFGMAETTRLFLPLVIKEKGRIVNMTSSMGRVAACTAPYCSSKFAAEGYSDILRRSIRKSGVTVHILEPGFFSTKFTDPDIIVAAIDDSFNKTSDEVRSYYGEEYKQECTFDICMYMCSLCRLDSDPEVFQTKETIAKDLIRYCLLFSNFSEMQVIASNLDSVKWCSKRTDKVVDAYLHALCSRFPKYRYVIGLDANIFFRFLWTVPEWIADHIIASRAPVPNGERCLQK